MKNFTLLLSVLDWFGLGTSILAQTPPEPGGPGGVAPPFEVATVRPNPAGGNRIEVSPGRVTITSATLAT